VKVLLIAEYRSFGGARTFFDRLLDIHRRMGWRTGLVATREQIEMLAPAAREGLSLFPIPPRSRRACRAYFSLFYEFRHYLPAVREFRPDVIFVSGAIPFIHWGVFLFGRPVIYMMHTYPTRRMSWKATGMKLIPRFALGPSRILATVSQRSAGWIRQSLGAPRHRIEVVHNAVAAIPRTEWPRDPVVLTVGDLEWHKNPAVWLESARRVVRESPGSRFVWLGGGSLLEEMRNRAKEMNLAPQVEFCGFRRDVADFYDRSRVCFQPSLIESHGIAVVEAMAHGLPCVVSDRGGMVESVVDGCTGYVCEADDAEGFARRILSCLADPELADRLGRAGQDRVRALFDTGAQEEKLLRLYEKVARRRAISRGSERGNG
jgi:glycosyltransferase involved in cell wall biosynthesis